MPLRLDRDGAWEFRTTADGYPLAILRATRTGILDYAVLARCTTREELKFPALPAFSRSTYLRGVQGPLLRAFAPMVVREFRQMIFALPPSLRPALRLTVRCEE